MTVPCKLNNAKTNKTPLTNLWICLKRKRKQPTKILELIARSDDSENDLKRESALDTIFESLILAQDERWRRA